MTKSKKKIITLLISVLAIISTCLSIGFALQTSVKASANSVFEMDYGASVRVTEPNTGLRFKTKLSKDYFDRLTAEGASETLYTAIFPSEDYPEFVSSGKELPTWLVEKYGAGKFINMEIPADKIYQGKGENSQYYYANAVISNVYLKNYHRKFIGVSYIVSGGAYEYAQNITLADNSRSIFDVACKANLDEEDHALHGDVLEKLIKNGMYAPYGVSYDKENKKYTLNGTEYDSIKDIENAVEDIKVTLSLDGATLNEGEKATLTPKVTYADGTVFEEKIGYVYTSSTESVATVDENGEVTAIGEGETTVTVKAAGGLYQTTCIVTVNKVEPIGDIIADCVYNMSSFTESDEIERANGFENLYKYVGPGHGNQGEYLHGGYMSNLSLDEYGVVTFAIKTPKICLAGTWNESNKWLIFTLTRVAQCEWDLVVTNQIGQVIHENTGLSGDRTDGAYVYNAINSILYGKPSPGYYPGDVTGDITVYVTELRGVEKPITPMGEIIQDCVYDTSVGYTTTDDIEPANGFENVYKVVGSGEAIHGMHYCGINLDSYEVVTFAVKTAWFNLNGEMSDYSNEWLTLTLTQVSADTWDLVVTQKGETVYSKSGLRGAYNSEENSAYSDNALDAIIFGNPKGFAPWEYNGELVAYVTELRGRTFPVEPVGEIIADCVYNMSSFTESDEIERANGFENLYKYVGPGHGNQGEYLHGGYMSNLSLDEYGVVTFAIKTPKICLAGTWNESNKWLIFTLTRVAQCEWDLVVTNQIGQVIHENTGLSGDRTDGAYVYNAINSILYGKPSPGYYPGNVTGDITVYATELRGVKDLSWVNKTIVLYDQVDGIGTVYNTITASFDVTELGVDLSKVTSVTVDGAQTTNYSVSGKTLSVTGLLAGDHVYKLTTGEREFEFIGCAYEVGITNATEFESWRTSGGFAVLLNDVDFGGITLSGRTGRVTKHSLDGRGYAVKNFVMVDALFERFYGDDSVFRNVKFENVTRDMSANTIYGILGMWLQGVIENVYIDISFINATSAIDGILVNGIDFIAGGGVNTITTVRNIFVNVRSSNQPCNSIINQVESRDLTYSNIVGVGVSSGVKGNSEGCGYSSISQMINGEINDELTTFTSPYWVIDDVNGIIDLKPLNEEIKPVVSVDGEFVGKDGENLIIDLSDKYIDANEIKQLTCDGSEIDYTVSGTSIVLAGLTAGDHVILAKGENEIYSVSAFVYDTEIRTAEQLTSWLSNPTTYAVLLSHINYGGATLNMGGNVTGVLNGLGYTVSNFTYSTGIVEGISASGGIKNVCFTGAKQEVGGTANKSCGLLGKTVSGYIKNLYVEISLLNCDGEHYAVLAETVSGCARNVIVYISSSNVVESHYVISKNNASVYEEVYGVYSNGAKYILAWITRNDVGEWSRANTYKTLEDLTSNCLSVLTWGDYWNNSWNSIKMNPYGEESSQTPDVEDGYIVKDGKTEYVVVVSDDELDDITTAAKELYDIFLEATGISLEFVSDSSATYSANAKYISLGRTQIAEVLGADVDALGEQGFILQTKDQSIFILGKPQGALYGVYEFLNQTLNFETYTKDIYTLDKGVTELALPEFNEIQIPDIEYRIQFSGVQYSDELSRRRMRTMRSDDVTISGGGAHNMLRFIVPFDEYYSTNATWFSNKTDSSDTYETTQLCYTAGGRGTASYTQMLNVAIENVKNMVANDDRYVFSLTQMDVQDMWCTCSGCQSVINQYGANSATQILFINDLVSAVNSWLETEMGGKEVQFMTFAYYDTETAPTGIKLDDSVAIWLAPIAGYRADNGVTAGRDSLESLINSWSSVASSVSVWAYGVYFNEYLVPYNNYDVLDELIQTAVSGNARYMWVQGNWNTTQNSCFDSLKEYLIAKLMWDKDASVDTLTANFFNAVYGTAASDMKAIYNTMKSQLNSMITAGDLKTGIYSAPCDYRSWDGTYLENQLKALITAIGKLDTNDANYQKYYDAIVCESISFRYIYKENNNLFGSLGGKDYSSDKWGSFKADVERLGFTRTGEASGKEMSNYNLLNK